MNNSRNASVIKSLMVYVIFVFCALGLFAQGGNFSTYYHQRRTLFELLPVTKGAIVFVGNSITDGGEWHELFAGRKVLNRGISGDVTEGILYRLHTIIDLKPSKLFLKIGTNDLARNVNPQTVFDNIALIVEKVRTQSPETEIYVQSILPVNAALGMFSGHTSKTSEIKWVNARLKEWAVDRPMVTYIDLFSHFKNKDDDFLNLKYTNDGLHLTGEGYMLWAKIISPYICGN